MDFNDCPVEIRGPREGLPVMLIHELPGLTAFCLSLADRLVARGFRVYMPLLFGRVGERAVVGNMVRLCVRKEFRRLALATNGLDDAPTTVALRKLSREIAELHPDLPGIGVIGMCLTGGFAMAMLLDPKDKVMVAVASQPSMPMPLGKRRSRSVGLGDEALGKLRARLVGPDPATLVALRFAHDALCPPERFDALRAALDGVEDSRLRCWSLDSGTAHIPLNAHSVLTEDFADWPGHPTRDAFEEVAKVLASRLRENLCGAAAAP